MNDTDDAPCLMLSHGQNIPEHSIYYNVYENNQLHTTTSIPMLCDKRILNSAAYGWLVLIDDNLDGEDDRSTNCWLWNPASTEIIQLPYLANITLAYSCVLSKPPNEPDCYILFVCYHGIRAAFCQIGDDEYIEHPIENDRSLITILVFKGRIYGMTCELQFVNIDFVAGEDGINKQLEFTSLSNIQIDYPMSQPWLNSHRNVLIESPCGRELLLVQHINYGGYCFRILRVDPHNMELQELESIGNRVIFLSACRGGGGVCRYSYNEKMKPNSIYYTIGYSKNIYLYDLDDQSNTILSPSPYPVFNSADDFEWYWIDPQISKYFVN